MAGSLYFFLHGLIQNYAYFENNFAEQLLKILNID
jgi:hypothetical protein